jgi:hypothetical protein
MTILEALSGSRFNPRFLATRDSNPHFSLHRLRRFQRLVERQGGGLLSRWWSSFRRRPGHVGWWVDSWRRTSGLGRQPRAATSHLVVLLRLPTSSCTLYSDPGLSASASSIAGWHGVRLSAGFLVDYYLLTASVGARPQLEPSAARPHTAALPSHVSCARTHCAACVSRSCTDHRRRSPAAASASISIGGGARRSSSTRAAPSLSPVRPPAAAAAQQPPLQQQQQPPQQPPPKQQQQQQQQ